MKLLDLIEEITLQRDSKNTSDNKTSTKKDLKSLSNKVNSTMKEVFHPEFLEEIYKRLPEKITLKSSKSDSRVEAYVKVGPNKLDINIERAIFNEFSTPKIEKYKFGKDKIYLPKKERFRYKIDRLLIHEIFHLVEFRYKKGQFRKITNLKRELLKSDEVFKEKHKFASGERVKIIEEMLAEFISGNVIWTNKTKRRGQSYEEFLHNTWKTKEIIKKHKIFSTRYINRVLIS